MYLLHNMSPSLGPSQRDIRPRVPGALLLRSLLKCAINYRGERRSLVRQYYFELSRHFSPSIAVDAHDIRYYVATDDRAIGRHTFMFYGFDDDKFHRAVTIAEQHTGRSLRERELIDVGANIGTTTIPALKHFGASHAWAFEPAVDNLRLLRCNVAANNVNDQVTIFPVALSDATRPAQLELSNGSSGDHRVVVTEQDGYFAESRRPRLTIQLATFDDVAREAHIDMDRIGLVWIDAQGHEGRILAGAQQILHAPTAVVVEYWPYGLRRSSCLDLFHTLVAQHYSLVIDIGCEQAPVEHLAEDVHELAAKYPAPTSFTDLLLI